MSKHAELIGDLRSVGCLVPVADLAADALEAQERESEGLGKEDEALIRQMLEALNLCCTAMDYLSEDERISGAIEAARARLEKAP